MAENGDDAGRHPIGVVTARTGLSRHVLRAWEKRYGVVEPRRSEGGHRLYSDADVERLRLLHRLTLHGRRIGQIAHLETPELQELLREDETAEATAPDVVEGPPDEDPRVGKLRAAAYEAAERFDAAGLEAIFRRAALALDTTTFVDGLVVPLMRRIGDAWEEGRLGPAQEHVASAVVVRVAGWLVDNFDPPPEAPGMVVGTPVGHLHELGALAAAAVAASEGWRVTYLGPNLPADEIARVAGRTGAEIVALSVVHPERDEAVVQDLRRLRRALDPGVDLVVGGRASESYAGVVEETGAERLGSFGELRERLRRRSLPSGA